MSNKLNFTKDALARLPVPESGRTEYHDTTERYLVLRVTPNGRRTFSYLRKWNGEVVRIALGTFPDITVAQARDLCKTHSGAYAAGADPRKARRELRETETLATVFAAYLEKEARPHKATWAQDEWIFTKRLATLHARRVNEIDKRTVTALHIRIGKENGHYMANRTLALLRHVLNFATDQGARLDRNPCDGVKMFREKSRSRFLSPDEVGRLFTALENEPNETLRDFFSLCLWTGARRGNVQAVRWEQLDLAGGKWTIPGDESKNREAMDVVLSAEALAVLQRRLDARDPDNPSAYVFPSRNENARVPHLCEPKAAWRRICKDARLFDLRIHDLRRSFGSWQAGAGASLLTIGKSLGHLDSDTTKVYARLDLAPVRESVDRATVALRAAIEAAKEKAKKEATA